MAAAERLQVGAVGERDLDPDEHVARARLRPWRPPPAARRPVRGRSAPSRDEDDLQRLAAPVELEAIGEPLERQHRRRRQLELGQQGAPLRASCRASRSASRRRSARGDTPAPPGSSPRRRRRAPCRRARPPRPRPRRRLSRRAPPRRRARPEPRPLRSGSRSTAKTSSPRRASTAENSRPMKPCPTTRTRPRGIRSTPRRTHASGSTAVPSASSSPSGSSSQPCAFTRSAKPPGRIVASAKRSQVDSCPARHRAHSPQAA